MEMPPPDHTETAEPGPSSGPPSYRDAQVWKDLEAETGFASCADYLEFYKDSRPDFEDRLEQFQELRASRSLINKQSPIVIYDLSKQEGLPISLSLRRHCHSGTELIQALREPPCNVCVQVVLWFLSFNPLDQELADALVLGLKLDPQFLEEHLGTLWSDWPRPREDFRASQIKFASGNSTIATISQSFMPDVVDAVPVLLVASHAKGSINRKTLEEILAGGDHGKPPVHRSALGEDRLFMETKSNDRKKRGQTYARTVEHFIAQGRFATPTKAPTKAFLVLAAMSPLLYAEAYRIRRALNQVKRTYNLIDSYGQDSSGESDQGLDRKRLDLRRVMENAEDNVTEIFRYLGSQVDADWSQEPSYVSVEADWRSLIAEARRLEAEIRDYMQLQVGSLALEESRKSIEEAKSVKIFTILAFIYVPLNLATSIFGMNIQQLNGSGQNLWAFFTTAVTALLLTGGSWLCSNSTYKAVLWYRKRPSAQGANHKSGEKRKYGLLLRMAMLVWLVRNGHQKWMWKSGAWLAILMNSNVLGQGGLQRDSQLAIPTMVF